MCLVSDGEDYLGDPGFVFFSPTAGSALPRRECFPISILNDSVPEKDETFKVVLALNNVTSGVIVDYPFTKVTILDDDGKGSNACNIEVNTHNTTLCSPDRYRIHQWTISS